MSIFTRRNRTLIWLARNIIGGRLIGWIFGNISFMLPVNRLLETDTLVCFYHPQPDYALHILIVPKHAISGLNEIDDSNQEFLIDLFESVQKLVDQFNLNEVGYRLIVNGGKYQEMNQLHFHLVSEDFKGNQKADRPLKPGL